MEQLIESAKSAWEADDGQSTEVDIARRVMRLAMSRGETVPDGAEATIIAALAITPVTPEMMEDQAKVSARYALADAARKRGDAEKSEWLSRVESARREVERVIRSYGSVDCWVPYMERAYEADGSIIATRMHHEQDGWMEWQATAKRVVVEPVARDSSPANKSNADVDAEEFVAALPSMTEAQAKDRYWSLSRESRNTAAIRNLPKAIRRQF